MVVITRLPSTERAGPRPFHLVAGSLRQALGGDGSYLRRCPVLGGEKEAIGPGCLSRMSLARARMLSGAGLERRIDAADRLTAEDLLMLRPEEIWPQETAPAPFLTEAASPARAVASGSRPCKM